MSTNDMFSIDYSPILGTFLNGAFINSANNFVDNIGGLMDGQLEIVLNAPTDGEYVLTLNYLGYGNDRVMKLEINGVDTVNNYVLKQTKSDEVIDAMEFSTIVNLMAGNNIVKIHGNGMDSGPSIGNINIKPIMTLTQTPTLFSEEPTPVFSSSPTTLITNYDTALGTLSNGAYVEVETNFVNGIGGTLNGSVEVPVTVGKSGEYNLTINYLAPYSNVILNVDVKENSFQNSYFMFKTPGNGEVTAQVFNIVVTLNSGNNIVKFHGNGTDIGPSIGTFTLSPVEAIVTTVDNITPTPVFSAAPTTLVTNYDLALGSLVNGAYVNSENNFVENIGGNFDGYVEIPLTVDKGGEYKLSINYLAYYDSTSLRIDVNAFDSGNVYYLPVTTDGIAQIFNVVVNLIAGNNLIKFYGNGMDKSPSIGQITIAPIEMLDNTIPTPVFSAGPTTLVTNYDAALGTLLNGAYINTITNFVDNIGGIVDGSVEIPLSVDKDGQYNLQFNYLAPFDNTVLKVDVNDVDSGDAYFIPQTVGSSVDTAQSFIVAIKLNAGNNKVKFHGNGIDLSPSIGAFTITLFTEITNTINDTTNPTPVFSAGPTILVINYDAALGTLSNGSYISTTTNFIDNLGGVVNGAVEVPLSVDKDGQYKLEFKYLSPLDNTSLKVDINDIDSGDVYFIEQTLGNTIEYAKSFSIAITLKAGGNKIKFHGNGIDMAPSIGTFNINFIKAIEDIITSEPTPVFSAGPTILVTNYDAALGTLSSGAYVNIATNFVDNLGGATDGAVEVPLSVDKDGEYKLEFKYLSPLDNTALNIDVNDIDSEDIYFIEQTTVIKSFNVAVNLKAGSNKVKFHGNGVDMAPSIGTFDINFIKDIDKQTSNVSTNEPTPVFSTGPSLVTNYDTALGTIFNNASINEMTNFVDNLGGATNGAVEVPLSVNKDGQYNIEIKYLSPFDNAILKIDINDIDTGENYFVSQTAGSTIDYAQSFNSVIDLKAGNNKIKFHGNGVDIAPSIGKFVISTISAGSTNSSVFSTTPIDLITKYNATLGTLSNNAIINERTNFVDNLGGVEDGAVEIPLTVIKEGEYNLELKYLAPFNNANLKVAVNDVDSEHVYFIEQTLDDAKIFNLVITLMSGSNKIKFHGDGINIAPSIGTFTITPIPSAVSDATAVFSVGANVLEKSYDASLGVLSNGASVNETTNFVDNLGGIEDGAVEIPLSVDKDGEYNLEFNYLSSNSNTRFKIALNGNDLGNNYFVVKTSGDTLNDAQLYNVIITLKAGINVIKFHGNKVDKAPSIGTFIISFIGTTPNNPSSVFTTASITVPIDYDAALGTIGGKASINSSTKMLDNIGGSQLGSSTINITVNNAGEYNLNLKYLSPNGISKLKIDVNNIVATTIYSLGKTNGNTLSNAQSFNTTLKLNSGSNKVKFYGDTTNKGLSIGKFTIKSSTLVNIQVYNSNTGSLANGAIINATTKFVDNIGGKIAGSVKLPIIVSSNGIYNLAINYLSPIGNSTMKISVNDINEVTVPSLLKTAGTSNTSIKIINASVKLNKGNNTIKISGDQSTPTFSVGVFTILLTTIVNDVTNTVSSYDITTASLTNGAVINKTTKFVENIGGKLKGTAEMNINIPKNGPYYVELDYLSPNGNSSLKIDINNKNTGTIYYMQKTNSNNSSDVKVYNTPLDLLSGKYKIKFYGNGTNIAPNLGNFSIIPITIVNMATVPIIPTSPLSKEYFLSKGTLSNGAIINKTTNFIEGLGGQDDGSVEVSTSSIPSDGTYLLAFRYLSVDDNSSLQISINGEDTGNNYMLAQTKTGDIKDVLLFLKTVTLSKGINKILFHGNGSDDGPSFEKFILTPIKIEKVSSTNKPSIFSATPSNMLVTNYDAALGSLGNGAGINDITSFVDNIGGVQDGESEVVLTVYNSGEYNLDLKYLSPNENTILKIMVNGADLVEDYFISKTISDSIEDAKMFSTTINLTEGKNLIKFHGNKVDNGPSISTFVISLIDEVSSSSSVFSTSPTSISDFVIDYDTSLGALSNNASIDSETNFVNNLGGINDGAVEVVLSIENSGQYDLNLQYLTPYSDANLKIDVNGVTSNNSYTIPKTIGSTINYIQIFNAQIDLMSGNNVIKFHGNGVNIAPWIGRFTIEPMMNNVTNNSSVFSAGSSQILITDYEATLGILLNGAVINEITNFVDNLGGILDGSVLVNLTVDKEGPYRLDVAYLSIYGGSVLKIEINGIDLETPYFISTTDQYDAENLNVFHETINLLKGKNVIRFHGDGLNIAPSIGTFIINPIIEENTMMTMNYLSINEKKKINIYEELASTNIVPTESILINQIALPLSIPMEIGLPSIKSIVPINLISEYDLTLGTLYNGAVVNEKTNMVDNISGTKRGAVEIVLIVDKTTKYTLALTYLSPNSKSKIRIAVNDIDLGVNYNMPQTLSYNIKDVKIFNIVVNLNLGKNKIVIYGKSEEESLSLGKIILKSVFFDKDPSLIYSTSPELTFITSYDAALGILTNGAFIDEKTNMVDNVGGKENGVVQETLTVIDEGEYNLALNYISPNEDTKLKIDVNEVDLGKVYSTGQTDSIATLYIVIKLNSGKNTIKFYGDGSNNGPSIGTFFIKPLNVISNIPSTSTVPTFSIVYDPILGKLSSGANINEVTNLVDNLGGLDDGAVEMLVKCDADGEYSVSFNYLSPGVDSNLKIDINGIDSGEVYPISKTLGNTSIEVQVFNITVKLRGGDNTLKFHGNKIDIAPSIGMFTVIPLDVLKIPMDLFSTSPIASNINNYEASLGILLNGAVVNEKTNFVDNIGGEVNGSVEVTIKVDSTAEYTLDLNYLSSNNNNNMMIDVNGINTGTIYNLTMTTEKFGVFNINLNLIEGVNVIKFYGDKVNNNLSIGSFTLNKSDNSIKTTTLYQPINQTMVNKNESTTNKIASLTGSAQVKDSFITGIGGALDGTVILTITIPNEGIYDFAMSYVALDNNAKVKIDVNNENTGVVYEFDKTASTNVIDHKNKVVQLYFKSGVNTIKIYS